MIPSSHRWKKKSTACPPHPVPSHPVPSRLVLSARLARSRAARASNSLSSTSSATPPGTVGILDAVAGAARTGEYDAERARDGVAVRAPVDRRAHGRDASSAAVELERQRVGGCGLAARRLDGVDSVGRGLAGDRGRGCGSQVRGQEDCRLSRYLMLVSWLSLVLPLSVVPLLDLPSSCAASLKESRGRLRGVAGLIPQFDCRPTQHSIARSRLRSLVFGSLRQASIP